MTKRETWGSKFGFILAAIGAAIGLGALWKLPYTMGQNGGGAFILLFVAFNFIIGLPLFIGEMVLGRQSGKGVVSSFMAFSEKGSAWSMVGWLIALVSLLILGWYCVVAGWGVCYILLSLTDSFQGLSVEEIGQSFDTLRASGSLNITFQIIYIALNAVVLIKGLSLGIEKASKIMTSGLFLVLIALALYATQLSGFGQALQYLFYPNFDALTPRGVLQALGLALFTLSLAYGVIITYGSYLKKDSDIPKTAVIVVTANIIASLLIAITIFPMIFSFGFEPQAGEGLIFKTMPYVFEQLPGSMIVALVFFVLFLFAALTSSLAMFEVVVANFTDLKMMSRKNAVIVTSCIVFVLGIPTAVIGEGGVFSSWSSIFGESFMETNILLVDWILVIIALFTTLFVAFKLSAEVRFEGFCSGSKYSYFYPVWIFLLRTVIPLAILLVIAHRAQIIQF
ncbi:MAG: sodium-dependent transporter [Myxococcales bacterium]|nr:sodium-dependent transporter [Myxococcales bacterium]USN51426.1 MAG: sodium-dependent transporter [Myxococcales bacterium]